MTEATTDETDDDTEPDLAAEGADSAGERASEESDQPDIDADEQADMDGLADLAEQVEAEAGANSENTDDSAEDATGDEPANAPPPTDGDGANWGDLYCSTVTTGLNAVIEEYGDKGAEPVDESLARDLHLDEYVNDWMAEQGKAEMDPAQGMILATVALCLTVLISKTNLPNQALTNATSDDSDD